MNCETYWGSHGCALDRGHAGFCACISCFDESDQAGYVGMFPYYGDITEFYGDDAPTAQAKFDLAVEAGLDKP